MSCVAAPIEAQRTNGQRAGVGYSDAMHAMVYTIRGVSVIIPKRIFRRRGIALFESGNSPDDAEHDLWAPLQRTSSQYTHSRCGG